MKTAFRILACMLAAILPAAAFAASPQVAATPGLPCEHFRVKPRTVFSDRGMFIQEVTIETPGRAQIMLHDETGGPVWVMEPAEGEKTARERVLIIVERFSVSEAKANLTADPADLNGDFLRTIFAYQHDPPSARKDLPPDSGKYAPPDAGYQSTTSTVSEDPGGWISGELKDERVLPYCEADCVSEEMGVKLLSVGNRRIGLHVSEPDEELLEQKGQEEGE